MEGQFENPLVIGKTAVPRCFRNINVKSLPVTWRFNKKAWMTSALFTEWVKDLNSKMKRAGRNVLLLLDNAPSHPVDLNLSNVKLLFLPANTTAKLQPLDQGIIQDMKQFYRKRLLRSVLAKIDDESVVSAESVSKSLNVLDAVQWVNSSIKDVKADTVTKCFRKAGFKESLFASDSVVVDDDDDDDDEDDNVPIQELVELMRVANKKISLGDTMTVKEYLDVDSNIPNGEDLSENWESDLLQTHKNTESEPVDSDSDDECSGVAPTPEPICDLKTHQDALKCIDQLKVYCMNKDLGSVSAMFSRAGEELEKLSVDALCSTLFL
ncbi:tigger transposable element-derived protein 6-like [Mercenaria mercenaria]|uniref:tigger transposable element-derived protein 6-like n=1 Tax=Mercenaria mercenaria TaxID=6596 RepID=UPI00234EF38A|nr:tigger transposable element-derived protein 6-like [Mercenaria mercenaria]